MHLSPLKALNKTKLTNSATNSSFTLNLEMFYSKVMVRSNSLIVMV